jgi:DNA-binding LacI/PurR family transcriptional regulator
MSGTSVEDSLRRRRGLNDHSYKFQRLRERIRQAVASGELSGKLPGERELARRFQVNAKTLSKALTDLAAEGLLSRSIGRGTFVKGAENQTTSVGRWMLVCDVDPLDPPLVDALRRHNPQLEIVRDVSALRPSFLNQFAAVIDLAAKTPEVFVRNLLVRNMPLVVVGREPRTYSTNAVLLDVSYLAARLGRELLMGGHRRLAVIQSQAKSEDCDVVKALRAAACRYAPDATVQVAQPETTIHLLEQGVTALIADSTKAAQDVKGLLAEAGINIPGVVSLATIGQADGDYPSTGFYLVPDQEAEAVIHLLEHSRSGGGTVLWLTGKYVDQATTGAASASASAAGPVLTLTA